MARNMHPEDIKAAVRKTGITLAELARRNGLSTSTTRKALRHPQPAGARVIAAYLGLSVHAIWPEWFAPNGTRIYRNEATANHLPQYPSRHWTA